MAEGGQAELGLLVKFDFFISSSSSQKFKKKKKKEDSYNFHLAFSNCCLHAIIPYNATIQLTFSRLLVGLEGFKVVIHASR